MIMLILSFSFMRLSLCSLFFELCFRIVKNDLKELEMTIKKEMAILDAFGKYGMNPQV